MPDSIITVMTGKQREKYEFLMSTIRRNLDEIDRSMNESDILINSAAAGSVLRRLEAIEIGSFGARLFVDDIPRKSS